MFSYRHAFHAGNHADVLKHLVLVAALRHLTQKETALWVVDTHAGAGLYRLDGDYAGTSGEAAEGILKLVAALPGLAEPAPALTDYLDRVHSFNREGSWRIYPGSPFLAQALLRQEVRDKLKLFELHPTDSKSLAANIAQLGAGRQVSVAREDGFEALKSVLPPPSRRALVLIDPSYEIKSDYAKVHAVLRDALQRFATGTYAVWYPIIPRPEAHELPRKLKTLANSFRKPWLHATFSIGQPDDAAPAPGEERRTGMAASGMFLVNPPHTLKPALQAALPQLLDVLGRGRGKGQLIESGGG
ncbi:MAG TPA: 23S rRNA (adenine(2030)-N(6))-methyltransferase RlmJ [Ramlibacter sp.]|jgi:23S rRNA (adenine2030-N6)-methyltransferase|uniref:23S rRNA (adenine(2030)-N(6))-methyltransferase RlmJ n=1 Tax=Ramlibacter sp. TaxID=1917967 RepID=UPI002D2D0DB7|nr:23S rRNA (adenine(2030)-N(6))-methyltransferase RlmJ [Ramlibacter sp.]HZY18829.1 23S rRNA (adenine(2030)-N(6))-methyltransferase RlmJ [Ramlibacter sp.]